MPKTNPVYYFLLSTIVATLVLTLPKEDIIMFMIITMFNASITFVMLMKEKQ